MCNGYRRRVKRGLCDDAFSQINVPLAWADAEPAAPASGINPPLAALFARALRRRLPPI